MKYGVLKTTVDLRRFNKVVFLDEIRAIAAGKTEVSWKPSSEEMTEVMKAIITNRKTRGIMNLPNEGQIENLPKDIVVETLSDINAGGAIPVRSGALPGTVGTLFRLHADIHELTVKAALNGYRNLLVEALSIDPLSAAADFTELGALADELISSNKKWLPRFAN